MAPKEGNSIVKHGVLDERLNVHGVKGLKVADLSICPDNVGCNTYSTALLIGEKCAMLTAEDLGYSGRALDMKVPEYHAPRYVMTALLSSRIVANVEPGRSPACRVCKSTCREVASEQGRVQTVPHDSYDSLTSNDMYTKFDEHALVSFLSQLLNHYPALKRALWSVINTLPESPPLHTRYQPTTARLLSLR